MRFSALFSFALLASSWFVFVSAPLAAHAQDTPSAALEAPLPVTPTSTATGIGLGTVTEYTLPNGLEVLVAPSDAADLVTMDVWVGAGTRRETAENNGVAHFMEHLIFKGTPTRGPGEIDAAIENLGGSLNAATSYDWAHFYATVDSADAPPALAVLADALQNAQMRQADINAEKPVILSEMARDAGTATGRISRVYNALEFPDHPYGRPLLGTADHVSNMPRAAILDFYHTYYAPGNATLVLAGHITPEAGLALARKNFGGWPVRAVPEDKTLPEAPQEGIREKALTAAVAHGFLQMGFHAPSVRQQPDAWVMDVLMTLLGQGGNNRLEGDLERKQKMVRAISTNYLTQRDPGTVSISAEFDPGDYSAVRDAVLSEAEALRDTPVSDAEIAAAKHTLLASYLFDAQTNSGRADALGFYSRIDTYKYDTEYIGHFESVTPAQIQDVARRYFDLSAYTIVSLLPPSRPDYRLPPITTGKTVLDTELAGLEVLIGCLGLLALVFAGFTAGMAALFNRLARRGTRSERHFFDSLLLDFCTGADQSAAKVNQIRSLLMTTFAQDSEYEELTRAAASFAPGGQPPFHDEDWLTGEFRAFLSSHGIAVPEQAKEKTRRLAAASQAASLRLWVPVKIRGLAP